MTAALRQVVFINTAPRSPTKAEPRMGRNYLVGRHCHVRSFYLSIAGAAHHLHVGISMPWESSRRAK
jgi:hypothetical protein